MNTGQVEQLLTALVTEWSGSRVRVKCPRCLKSHGHSTATFGLWRTEIRRSDCDGEGDHYRILFSSAVEPEAFGYGWEFDKTDGTFYTTDRKGRLQLTDSRWPAYRTVVKPGLRPDEVDSDKDDFDLLTRKTALLGVGDDDEKNCRATPQSPEEIWEELIGQADYRHALYISACARRDMNELRWLFGAFQDDFAQMTCSDGNDNGITIAASEEDAVPIVRFLQEKGVKLEHVNAYGRTALMEAALWGRAETVKYLIDQEVDLEARDGNGMTAVDLAIDLQRNREERESRAGHVYREPSDADHLRKVIAARLQRK